MSLSKPVGFAASSVESLNIQQLLLASALDDFWSLPEEKRDERGVVARILASYPDRARWSASLRFMSACPKRSA